MGFLCSSHLTYFNVHPQKKHIFQRENLHTCTSYLYYMCTFFQKKIERQKTVNFEFLKNRPRQSSSSIWHFQRIELLSCGAKLTCTRAMLRQDCRSLFSSLVLVESIQSQSRCPVPKSKKVIQPTGSKSNQGPSLFLQL